MSVGAGARRSADAMRDWSFFVIADTWSCSGKGGSPNTDAHRAGVLRGTGAAIVTYGQDPRPANPHFRGLRLRILTGRDRQMRAPIVQAAPYRTTATGAHGQMDWAYHPATNLIAIFIEGIVTGALLVILVDDLMFKLARRARRRRELRTRR
jgi:hypothetical protein